MSKTGIYDFFSINKYYCYESTTFEKNKLIAQYELDSILINESSGIDTITTSNNLKPYLIDHMNPSTLDYNEKDFIYDEANIQSIKDMGYKKNRVAYSWNMFNCLLNMNKLLTPTSIANLSIDLENYFNYQKGVIQDKSISKEDCIVIPVYDNLNVDAQELILSKFKDRNKTNLLWRSVAACLGIQDKYSKYNLKDNDEIIIIDRHGKTILFTKITLVYEKNENRLIPSHKSFKDSYNNNNIDYYQTKIINSYKTIIRDYWEALYYPQKKVFPILINDKWELSNNTKPEQFSMLNEIPFSDISNVKMILILDKSIKNTFSNIPVHYAENNIIAKGSAIFSQLKSEGMIPYFDHCDGLHMVYQKDNNGYRTIEYTTLIEENDRAEGGKIIQGKINDKFSIDKGNKFARFLIRIGTNDIKAQLKVLKQDFNENKLLTKWQLSLNPSMSPGQGRAQIIITCKSKKDNISEKEKPFHEVMLDWSKLQDSPDTIESLRKKLPKAFPPPINMVRSESKENINYILRNRIIHFISGKRKYIFDINNTKWPYKKENNIKRFQRTNYFGNEEGYRYPNLGEDTNIIIHNFLTKLAENSKVYLKTIAWTYQGRSQKYFNKIIDETLQDVSQQRLSPVQASLLVNLLEDSTEKDLILVFKACLKKFEQSYVKNNNWLRCIYQLLMYHEFVSSSEITDKECENMMNLLIRIYSHSNSSGEWVISNNCLRAILFLLKRRQVAPQFCKKDSNDGLYDKIKSLLPYDKYHKDYDLIKTIIGFLDGDGSLAGIPLD